MPTKCRPANDELTPAQRREELSAILAVGMLRRTRRARPSGLATPKQTCPQPEIPLDLPCDLRLSVPHRTAG